MEINFYGGNCVKISNRQTSLIVDDNLEELGLTTKTTDNDIVLITSDSLKANKKGRFVINGPGQYEIAGASIKGISARAHLDESGEQATIYYINVGGLSVAIVGHIYPDLSDEQEEDLGMIDVLVVPVGGNGYTLDSIGASKIIKKISPKIVIPTHYEDSSIKYEVPQAPLDEFLKTMGTNIDDIEKVKSLKIKESDLPDKMKIVVVEKN